MKSTTVDPKVSYQKICRPLRCFIPLTLILTMVLALAMSVPAAAAKKKLVKSCREFDADGRLSFEYSSVYDAKGNETRFSYTQYLDGKADYSESTTSKNTYWKKTRILKQVVTTGPDYSETKTYTKKGVLKKSVTTGSDGEKNVTTYKSSGRKLKSSKTVDLRGKMIDQTLYDAHGQTKKHTDYDTDGSATVMKFTNKYKNGKLQKKTIRTSDSTVIETYDVKENVIRREEKENGKATAIITYKNKYNKAGYLIEQTAYADGKLLSTTVYTYTGKAYFVDN